MADNATLPAVTPFNVTSDEITYSGDTTKLQIIRLVHVTGPEGSKVLTELADTTGLNSHPQPTTSGGCSMFHLVAAATTNLTNIKASAGQVYGISVFNLAASPRYVKFHNTAGTPTAGAGVVRTVAVQAGTSIERAFPTGIAFATGIAISTVTGILDANTSAVSASDLVIDVEYK